ncbi:hypothetical protein K435DRAFT_960334 [Dendrothele bispora CBS 962.96]|uniref:GIY-YIG domain-containing protein n=1 Tax=Dendrothele bispora (strain CBS 962.96) TaxID=1314807 RepID=A0A4S8MU16_DENBC|nr:hypothetical protein K435DRAFT_960334 [Dendrothele bispora CBS 962.96]
MPNIRPGNRSSLLSHTFPHFYACYLLKSIQSPNSKATYIGSTPDPPRRIRQHNGELTQGAWKTRSKRPWVMQMIVYGFPSKLAALQFEWAWQHPHLSRHLKDEEGKAVFSSTGRYLKQNILILRYMITHHPYDTWPLHVKIFTPEAEKCWNGLDALSHLSGVKRGMKVASPPLPRGFKWTVELEGVDGKSGKVGSGRKGPLEVKDDGFTFPYLRKNQTLLASNIQPECAICKESLPVARYTEEPLTHALCPHDSCLSVAHLTCLSQEFLKQSSPLVSSSSHSLPMVPRGGTCPGCRHYVLWGDVVKGMYRRLAEGVSESEEQEFDEEAYGKMFESDSVLSENQEDGIGNPRISKTNKGKGKASAKIKTGTKRRKSGSGQPSSSEGEEFDFTEVNNAVFSDDDLDSMSPRTSKTPKASKMLTHRVVGGKTKGRNQRTPVVHTIPVSSATTVPLFMSSTSNETTPEKKRRTPRGQVGKESSSEGEFFDFDEVDRMSTTDEEAPAEAKVKTLTKTGLTTPSPRKRGRPPKSSTGSTRSLYTLAHSKSPKCDKSSSKAVGNERKQAAGLRHAVGPYLSSEEPYYHEMETMLNDTDASDFSVEERLVRTMSSLSMSEPAISPSIPIIEISD